MKTSQSRTSSNEVKAEVDDSCTCHNVGMVFLIVVGIASFIGANIWLINYHPNFYLRIYQFWFKKLLPKHVTRKKLNRKERLRQIRKALKGITYDPYWDSKDYLWEGSPVSFREYNRLKYG